MRYFYELERDFKLPLVLWGAGKNGKDLAKIITPRETSFKWVCDNEQKIGKDIYGTTIHHFNELMQLDRPQVIIAVASPEAQKEINNQLIKWGLVAGENYWFFS